MLEYTTQPDADGKRTVVCSACGYTRHSEWPREKIHHLCPGRKKTVGPGTHLARMFKQIEVSGRGCGACFGMQIEMDMLGPAGCRQDFDRLLANLRKRYREKDVRAKFLAAGKALLARLPWSLAGFLREAIRRAEADRP